MRHNKNILKAILSISIISLLIILSNKNTTFEIKDIIQTNLSKGLRIVKVTEERVKINDENISIDLKMPEIHYTNTESERQINTYLRKNINEFINSQRQILDLNKESEKIHITITYSVAFEDSNLLNIIIYRNSNEGKKNFKLEKDSYLFDLKTGQRVYLNNFLSNNPDYQEVISNYIYESIKKSKEEIDKDKININKYTNFIITDGGIIVYFNPYKQNGDNLNYEFKIPEEIFKNKIRTSNTESIVANVDTQTIVKNNKYISSVINIPIIITSNKELDRYVNDKIRADIMKFYADSEEEAKKYLDDFVQLDQKFVANVNFNVKKNSNNILSMSVRYYKYSGGAHGSYEDVSYNIHMNEAKILVLSDLFKENTQYKKVIDAEIRKQIEDKIKKDKEYEGIYQFKGIKDNNKFYIQDNNLVIYFDEYEIAPYAAGQPEFYININTINHILKDEYMEIFK